MDIRENFPANTDTERIFFGFNENMQIFSCIFIIYGRIQSDLLKMSTERIEFRLLLISVRMMIRILNISYMLM